jgi:hypothetical protein
VSLEDRAPRTFARRGAFMPVLAIAGALLLGSNADAADEQTSALSWVELPGSEGCGGAAGVARAVEDRLGRHVLVSLAQADVTIEARIERTGDPSGWRAVVEKHDAGGALLGTRQLESQAVDCGELRESLLLAIALMIDPDATLRPPPSASQGPVVARSEVPLPPETGETWHAGLTAGLGVAYGLLPAVAPGIRITLLLEPPWFWGIEIYGAAWAPDSVLSEGAGSTRFTLTSGGVAVCPLRVENRLHQALRVCGGADVGRLHAQGLGFLPSRGGAITTLDAVAAGDLSVPLAGPVALRVGAQIHLASHLDQFVYVDSTGAQRQVFERPLFAVAGDLGVAIGVP